MDRKELQEIKENLERSRSWLQEIKNSKASMQCNAMQCNSIITKFFVLA